MKGSKIILNPLAGHVGCAIKQKKEQLHVQNTKNLSNPDLALFVH